MFGSLERRRGDERILEGGERKIVRYLIPYFREHFLRK